MTANFRKPGLLYPSQSALTLPPPVPFVTRFRPATQRTATKADKEYRRALHAAEQAVWDAKSPGALLRAEASAAAQDTPAEKVAFTIVTALALSGIVWGLVNTFHLVERWGDFVAVIRQLIA